MLPRDPLDSVTNQYDPKSGKNPFNNVLKLNLVSPFFSQNPLFPPFYLVKIKKTQDCSNGGHLWTWRPYTFEPPINPLQNVV